jgi:ADP-ribose pyrophosphatase YjhB (NUDIX family)
MDNLLKPHRIRVKALAWIEDKGMLFVVKMHDSVKGDDYYRPVGGSVEFGEPSMDAVLREVREELSTEIQPIAPPFVIENHFTLEGEEGHEIVFLFPSRFLDLAFYENKLYPLTEINGDDWDAMWVPINECVSGVLRLVPEELKTWYTHKVGGIQK